MSLPKWITPKIIAWSFYDFADTAFSALFITFFFPILIKVHLGGNEFHIGLVMGLGVLVSAFFVPFVGAISDKTGRRIPLLMGAAFATAALGIITGYSPLGWALFAGFLARITHLVSKDLYDAKMVDITPRENYGVVSGFGVSVGYVGAITSIGVAYLLLSHFGWESINGIRAMFWESAIFYIIFSLPLLFLLPERQASVRLSFKEALRGGFRETKKSIATLIRLFVQKSEVVTSADKYMKSFGHFLAASFFYNNGMNTVIIFLALYAIEILGFSVQQFFPIFALMALSAAVGSVIFGRLADVYGPAPLIKLLLVTWVIIVLMLIVVPSAQVFLITGIVGGAALGAIWTLNRHMVAIISPRSKIGELFGFEGLTEKFSGLLGPVLFGYLVTNYSYTPALISVVVFFAIGMVFMWRLKLD